MKSYKNLIQNSQFLIVNVNLPMVDDSGIEPLTPSTSKRCSTTELIVLVQILSLRFEYFSSQIFT